MIAQRLASPQPREGEEGFAAIAQPNFEAVAPAATDEGAAAGELEMGEGVDSEVQLLARSSDGEFLSGSPRGDVSTRAIRQLRCDV